MKRNYSLDEFGVKKHDLVLDNGLQVIFIEKPFAPIYANLMIRAGSIFNNGDTGLAHFTEHVIVSGSEKYPKKEDFAGIIASIGGYSNANTGRSTMCVECEVAIPEHMKNMKEYFSESLTGLYITQQSLEKEIGVITSEIGESMAKPEYSAGRYAANIWANNTNWGCSNLGTIESVASITEDSVRNFFSTYCCVENMLLVIAGGCKKEDVIETFSNIKFLHGTRALLPSSPEALPPNQRIFFEQNIPKTNIGLFFEMPSVTTRDSVLLHFAFAFSHDGLSSRFFKKIRNERGLAYSVHSPEIQLNLLRYRGTATSVPMEKTDIAIESILECYEEFIKEGFTQKEYQDKLDTIWFSEIRNKETAYDWVKEFSDVYPEMNHIVGDFPDWNNYMTTVTADELNDVIKKYIIPDQYHLYVNGKQKSSKYF